MLRVVVDRRAGHGLEAAARLPAWTRSRTSWRGAAWWATAHHLRDQAETFLLRALRGSGVDGLAAMPALRAHAGGWLWRPLLAVPRAALQAYAVAHGLAWVDDPANLDEHHDRSFLRLRVMPVLRAAGSLPMRLSPRAVLARGCRCWETTTTRRATLVGAEAR